MGRRKKKGYLHIVTWGMAVLCLFLVAACAACIGKDVQKGIEKGLKEKGSIPYQDVYKRQALKKLKGSEVSEDEIKDMEEELQKVTDKFVKKVDEAVEAKSKEVMTV